MTTADQYDQNYTNRQLQSGRLRKALRNRYMRAAAGFVHGPTVDLGCGVGDLLIRLPASSMGLEINKATVDHCRRIGLDVEYYDGYDDDWKLGPVVARSTRFESLVLSHVLEHLDAPTEVLHRVLQSTSEAGIGTVLVQVPGRAGYRHDPTHRTFVDLAMLADQSVTAGTDYTLAHFSYFPGNLRRIGDYFTYHELRVLYAVGTSAR